MLAYYILILIPCFVFGLNAYARIGDLTNKKLAVKRTTANKLTVFSFFAIFLFLLCVRDFSVGVDIEAYIKEYEVNKLRQWSYLSEMEWEWGWFIFQKLLLLISDDPRFFIVICAIVTVLPIWIFYRNDSGNPLVAIALFMVVAPFSMFFSGLRQSIAMAFGVWAFACLKRKHFIGFILTVFIAIMFHQSAFVLILMLPLYFIKFKAKYSWLIVLVVLIFFIFRRQIFQGLLSILPERYIDRYGNNDEAHGYGMYILIILFTVFSFIIADEKRMNREDFALRSMMVIAVVLQTFATIDGMAMRFNYYFLLLVPVYISRMVERTKDEVVPISIVSMVIICAAMFIYFILNGYFSADILHIFPYVWMW